MAITSSIVNRRCALTLCTPSDDATTAVIASAILASTSTITMAPGPPIMVPYIATNLPPAAVTSFSWSEYPGLSDQREATRQGNRRLSCRAALAVPQLPLLSPRMICSCRCVVREAKPLLGRLYRNASDCRNLAVKSSNALGRLSRTLTTARHDGIDL
jgi:hypothetical protein